MLDEPDVKRLQQFALDVLPTLQHPDGLYCFDRTVGGPLRDTSLRYTLMVRLGLQRAARSGSASSAQDPTVVDAVRDRMHALTPGDLGLLAWAEARDHHETVPELVIRLDALVNAPGLLAGLEGMEVAWIGLGLAHALEAGEAMAAAPLRRVIDHLLVERRARSGLYVHVVSDRLRKALPNFATEIYTELLLAKVGAIGADGRALDAAVALADLLLRLRRDDAAWPWLYDAERGTVVEVYEVYSVHQDAMAPMALFELAEATGDDVWAQRAAEGLGYCYGANELGALFYDDAARFAHRSIRRPAPLSTIVNMSNAGFERVTGRALVVGAKHLELNQTCRPYHLGWVLEAWAGREHYADLARRDPGSEAGAGFGA